MRKRRDTRGSIRLPAPPIRLIRLIRVSPPFNALYTLNYFAISPSFR